MLKFYVPSIIFIFMIISGFGQEIDHILHRLSAIENNGTVFYDIDGMMLFSRKVNKPFTAQHIFMQFKDFGVKRKDLTRQDSTYPNRNFHINKRIKTEGSGFGENHLYFFENKSQTITGISITCMDSCDPLILKSLIQLIVEEQIPANKFANPKPDTIIFAGRKIKLGASCHWMGVNNVQCSGYGQMNWSLHDSLVHAQQYVNLFLDQKLTTGKIKPIEDKEVMVLFEGNHVTARKLVVDIKGINSLLVGMSGGKTLEIYGVAAEVRGYNISCILSFWNNDARGPSGLAPLLEEVMLLE